ncbi:MAG TPA: cytochrome C oxidase subunit IV family protein [Lacipirellula sp.]
MSETAQPTLKIYFLVYAALMIGLAATVGAAYLPHGPWSLPAALAIAFAKAALVVMFFMHVLYSPRLTWIAVFAGLVWLSILMAITFADYMSRDWIPTSQPKTGLALPPGAESVEPPRAAAEMGTVDAPDAAD